MTDRLDCDICIIGAGSGGLSVAAGAAQLGARTVLVEGHRMGGDCLNTGCVPSKALIAAGRAAVAVRQAGRFGIVVGEARTDFARVRAHVDGAIAAIAPHDSVARFEGLGVRVILAPARFVSAGEIAAGPHSIRARRFVVATGAVPVVPPIPGLERTPYLTNETIFELDRLPSHLVIIGGGAVGVELGQAFARLGAEVTIIEMQSLLAREDAEAVDVLRRRLVAEGVRLCEGASVESTEATGPGIAVEMLANGKRERVEGSHLLVAVGRRPKIDGLALEAAGIAYDQAGIRVDSRQRTSNRRVYAIGDVAGGPQFTHAASAQARTVIRDALFRLPAWGRTPTLPRVIYAEPELAQAGLDETSARAQGQEVSVQRWPFDDLDRVLTDGLGEGFVKVIAGARGRILGVTIVGPQAGELIQPWLLAMDNGLKLSALARMTTPYPTLGQINRHLAGGYYAQRLFRPWTRTLVRLLWRLG